MPLTLRPYQLESVEALRAGVRAGHRSQLLCSPTGSGKTVLATFLMQEASNKMSRSAFIVDRVSLIDQTSKMFEDYGIEHGVIQGSHWRYKPWERVQVCSAQTLARREFPGDLKLIVVDEAHTMWKGTIDFIKANPNVIVLGLTATPFTKGLGALYTNVVNVTTTDKLVEEGFLAPLKAYAAKRIDLTGARIKFDGEWRDEDVEKRGIEIVGDVVQCWIEKTQQHFGGPAKTIVFSATVAHGEELCRQFQAAGHNFQQVSYKDGNDDRRRALIEEFRKENSEIVGLISCEALAKGFDVPDILVGVSCRPYRKSLSGHVQSMGRVMRPSPGKSYALWLDHSGNYLRFSDDTATFFAEGVNELDEKGLDSKVRKEPVKYEMDWACHQCKFIMAQKDLHCPSCGWVRPRRRNEIEHEPGVLVGVDLKKAKREESLGDKESVWRQIVGYALESKPPEKAEKWGLAQYRSIYGHWPKYAMRNVEPLEPTPKVVSKIKSLQIAYFKGHQSKQQEKTSTLQRLINPNCYLSRLKAFESQKAQSE